LGEGSIALTKNLRFGERENGANGRADCPVRLLCQGAVEWPSTTILSTAGAQSKASGRFLRTKTALPDHPLLHIALAGFETDPKRADFLRSFGLARLPKKSDICTRAGEMLLAQQRPELALAAVDNALLADPKDLSAQRLRVKLLDAMPR